jgi:uncharacterized membrane protein YdjX (TVP38/TMEM64 family)
MRAVHRRRVVLAALGLVVAAAAAMAALPQGRSLLAQGVALLGAAGAGGRAAGVALVVVGIPMGVPTLWLAALVGFLYGPALGLPVALVAVWLGAMAAFTLARWLLCEQVERLIARRRRWRAVVDSVGDGGIRLVVLLRLAGPHNVLNFALAASPITWRQFAAGTFIGSLPSVALAALGGALARDASSLWRARDQLGGAWLVLVVAGAGALILAVALMVRATRRALAVRPQPASVAGPPAPTPGAPS